MKKHAPSTPLEERLLSRREITEAGCWKWTGATDRYGYGKIKWKGKLYKTHRCALHVWKSMPLDDARYGLHSCDFPTCFNPDHLEAGTPLENVTDIWKRKRFHDTRGKNGQWVTPNDVPIDLPF